MIESCEFFTIFTFSEISTFVKVSLNILKTFMSFFWIISHTYENSRSARNNQTEAEILIHSIRNIQSRRLYLAVFNDESRSCKLMKESSRMCNEFNENRSTHRQDVNENKTLLHLSVVFFLRAVIVIMSGTAIFPNNSTELHQNFKMIELIIDTSNG